MQYTTFFLHKSESCACTTVAQQETKQAYICNCVLQDIFQKHCSYVNGALQGMLQRYSANLDFLFVAAMLQLCCLHCCKEHYKLHCLVLLDVQLLLKIGF